jgi:cardiolipin synthase
MHLRPAQHFFFWILTVIAMIAVGCSPGTRIARKHPINRNICVKSTSFEKAIATVVQSPWETGNHITTLVNGDAFYPAMLSDILSAKKTITFETYAFVEGSITQQFINAFCDRAHHGVKVHLILDSIGSIDIGKHNIQRLKKSGVQVHIYHPYSVINPLRYNTRDHRKLMVVDGKIGYTGGCGIADAWTGDAQDPKHWRENHYRVTGPVVAQIQQAFLDNWKQTGGSPLTGADYFPNLRPTGKLNAQVFISSPKDKIYTIPHLYRQVIASARKNIIIENSYFIPDQAVFREILAARKRGVHVEILVPGDHTDAWPVRSLAHGYHAKLLRAGVHIYEYQKTMMHCKVMIVDDYFTSIGSANFDPRSLYINDESNLNVLDATFAREQKRIIERDKANSLRLLVPTSHWTPLTLPQRVTAQIIAPQL